MNEEMRKGFLHQLQDVFGWPKNRFSTQLGNADIFINDAVQDRWVIWQAAWSASRKSLITPEMELCIGDGIVALEEVAAWERTKAHGEELLGEVMRSESCKHAAESLLKSVAMLHTLLPAEKESDNG